MYGIKETTSIAERTYICTNDEVLSSQRLRSLQRMMFTGMQVLSRLHPDDYNFLGGDQLDEVLGDMFEEAEELVNGLL